ncbi:TraR/DksA family transcriptional regulator [Planktomarina temperata]|nr:TraR/DksA family transcriptional regulator [Planktomarina temperata]
MDIQLAKYKEPIEQQLEELTAEDVLGQSAQKTVELNQQSVGRLSRMDALQSQAMAQEQQRRRDALKQALQAALRRLSEDEFSYFMECGGEIEEVRLLANPTVLKCMACIKS